MSVSVVGLNASSAASSSALADAASASMQDVTAEPGDSELDFTPLTADQARALRERNPSWSPWWVVFWQAVVGFGVVGAAFLVSGRPVVAVSAAWGVAAVVVPAALFARGLTGRFASVNVGSAVLSFFVWELIKIVATVGILFAAQRLVSGLSWLAMLLGLIVTIKVYWLALAFKRKSHSVRIKNA